MTDVFSQAKRSEVMSRIRARGNRDTELALVAFFRAHGVTGWRRHRPLFGRPDFIFPARRLAVFVDGCFWHGCRRHARMPKTHAAFWRRKLARNQARDKLVNRTLKAAGWRVLRVWEHELARRHTVRLLLKIHRALAAGGSGRPGKGLRGRPRTLRWANAAFAP